MYAHGMQGPTSPESGANLLCNSASSYLRSAAHQPVWWHPWGEEALRRAQAEDKPVLLDSGAVWCHWCHVMDRESYEDAEIAALINQHFIAVKVDRDERPDVDARYQAAVQAIRGQGGWPLTVFLTPDGRPYFGATYLPRQDRLDSPGFARVLEAMAQVWRERRDEALETATEVMKALDSFPRLGGEPGLGQAKKIAAAALKLFDPRYGGFGTQPKFPHPAAVDLLLAEAVEGNEEAARAARLTLEKMARGGVYDQVGGGFHRYSVDERWQVPHFEKMLYDNTELLRNYVHGWQALGREEFRRTALDILGWLTGEMSDRERGGFYASQDADIDLEDDGDFFTWTRAEAREALQAAGFSEAETGLALEVWAIRELGDMHHDPARNVLRVERTVEEMAAAGDVEAEELHGFVGRAREALRAARRRRTAPRIDRTIYTGWNGMAVSALLEAASALGLKEAREFARKTLDRLLNEVLETLPDGTVRLWRVASYAEAEGLAEGRVRGTLEDYAFLLLACLDGYEATGEWRYFQAAKGLGLALRKRFEDREEGGFFDTEAGDGGKLGALEARLKPIQDASTPAGNPVAAVGLRRLAGLGAGEEFHRAAGRALGAFAGGAEQLGLYAASYGLAVRDWLLEPEQVVVVGAGETAEAMAREARREFRPSRRVIRLEAGKQELPPALAETVGRAAAREGTWALVCRGNTCLAPVDSVAGLREALGG
jgi:hypothetical protein